MSSVATLSRNRQRRYFSLGSTEALAAMSMPGPVSVAAASLSASVVDTVTVSEDVSNLLTMLRTVTDTVTVTETISVLEAMMQAVTDTVTVSENVANLLSHFGSVTDTVTVSETLAKLLTQTTATADTVALSESLANAVDAFVTTIDTVAVTESASLAMLFLATTFDAVTLSESQAFAREMSAFVIDTVTLTDALTEPLTWTIRAGATALEGVKVWLSYADPYTANNLVRDSIKTTNSSGQVSYDIDFDVVYFGWRDAQAYTFPDPFRFRYSSANSRWEQWDGSAYVEWTP